MVKEDDGMFTVTVQKFGETTRSVIVSIRARASNPTSARRMYMIDKFWYLIVTEFAITSTFCIPRNTNLKN